MGFRNLLLRSLPEAEQERLEPYWEQVTLESGQVLIEADQPIEFVWFPEDAVSSTLQLLRNGETVEAGLMGLEGMVGIQLWLRQATTPSRTIIQVPGTAMRMSTDDFITEVVRRPDSPLNDLIAAYIHGFLTMTSQTAACNRMHQVDQRLCRWLRMVYNRVPNRVEYPLRQEFLAAMLGVQRPTVSTVASILQRAGFIEYTRGRLRVLDAAGLAQGACECYEIMEAQFDKMFDEPWRPPEQPSKGVLLTS
jgi:CRP-like cAMP-binding protein